MKVGTWNSRPHSLSAALSMVVASIVGRMLFCCSRKLYILLLRFSFKDRSVSTASLTRAMPDRLELLKA